MTFLAGHQRHRGDNFKSFQNPLSTFGTFITFAVFKPIFEACFYFVHHGFPQIIQQLSGQYDSCGSTGIGEKTEVANSFEPFGDDVQQEAADKVD